MAHDVQKLRLESSVQSPDFVESMWSDGGGQLRTGPALGLQWLARGEQAAPRAPSFEPVCGAPARQLRLGRRGGRAANCGPPGRRLKLASKRAAAALLGGSARSAQSAERPLASHCRTSAGPQVLCGHCWGTGLQSPESIHVDSTKPGLWSPGATPEPGSAG